MKRKLNSKKIIRIIEDKKTELKKLGVKEIGIFGSFIKNKQNKKSDVDVIVSLKKITFKEYMHLKFMLEKLLKRKIDLIIKQDLRKELNYIKKEAEYARYKLYLNDILESIKKIEITTREISKEEFKKDINILKNEK